MGKDVFKFSLIEVGDLIVSRGAQRRQWAGDLSSIYGFILSFYVYVCLVRQKKYMELLK